MTIQWMLRNYTPLLFRYWVQISTERKVIKQRNLSNIKQSTFRRQKNIKNYEKIYDLIFIENFLNVFIHLFPCFILKIILYVYAWSRYDILKTKQTTKTVPSYLRSSVFLCSWCSYTIFWITYHNNNIDRFKFKLLVKKLWKPLSATLTPWLLLSNHHLYLFLYSPRLYSLSLCA